MKRLAIIVSVLLTAGAALAQSGDEMAVKQRVDLLNKTVFGTKDSATLDGLLAKEVTYGHSSGVVENRKEALHNGSVNNYKYVSFETSGYSVFFAGGSAIVRYIITVDQGTPSKLNLGMLQVWVKEGKDWKLTARQAVRATAP